MKLFEIKKLEEMLQQNWTKYIDYKLLLGFVINAVPLYAQNWPTIMQYKKFQGNKITVTRAIIQEEYILFDLAFEVITENGVSAGSIVLKTTFDGSAKLQNINGNVFC